MGTTTTKAGTRRPGRRRGGAWLALMVTASLLLAGCATVEDRIRERPQAFYRLDPPTQAAIRAGRVELGFTEEMVWLALGDPDERRSLVTAEGPRAVWIYLGLYPVYEGPRLLGFHRHLIHDRHIGGGRYVYTPIYDDGYRYELRETLRVQLSGGRVTAIERSDYRGN